ncbi:MAG: phage tail tape measure protein [Gordonibacter sp.]|uniref:phage tail tape measure protein n=1 Tax=Gordonibacter sp. TaxID=1968902 RepID=UPI002FC8A5EA
MAADGTVTIKAILDSSGVKRGVSEIDNSVGGLKTDGVDRLGKSSKSAGDEFEGAGKKTGSAASTMKSAGVAMTAVGAGLTAGVTLPLAAMGKHAFDSAASFQTSMNMVKQATGASSDDMATLSAYAKQMGADTIYSAGEAGAAMLELAKSGMTPAQIQGGALATSMDLAAAGNLGLADAANITVQAMSMFGIPAEESAQAANALAGAANASTADVSDLAQGLSQCGTVASNAGWSIQDTTGALAMFADAGISGSDAGTSLKTMLLSLEAPSTAAKTAMDQYGISLYNSDGSMKNTAAMAQNLQDGIGSLSAEQQNAALVTMFGSDATRVAAIMMENGASGVDKYTAACSDQGAAADMASARNSGWAGIMEKMSGTIDTIVVTIGERLAPVITQVADWVCGLGDAFMALDPNIQNVILAVLAVVAAIGPLLIIIGPIISSVGMLVGVIGPAVAAAGGLGAAFGAVAASIGAVVAPVLAIVAGIAALAAIVKYAWDTNEGFRNAVTTGWTAIQAAISAVMEQLRPYIEQAWAAIQAAIENVMNIIGPLVANTFTFIVTVVVPILESILQTVGNVFQEILTTITGVMDGISQIISGVWSIIQGVFDTVLGFIIGLVTGDFSLMQSGIDSIMNGILGVIQGIWNTISSFISGVLSGIASVVSGIWGGILSTIEGIMSGIWNVISDKMGLAKDTVQAGLDAIAGFFGSLKIEFPHINLPHFSISGSFSLDPPSMPSIGVDWYAKGGIFNGASIIGVGEAGPEAVVPLLGRRMQPFADAVAAGIHPQGINSGGGISVAVSIDTFINKTDRDIDELVKIIATKIKRESHARG